MPPVKRRKRSRRLSEMRSEYDFSGGVRGKYAGLGGGSMIPGVRFLVDEAGQKTAVMIDLRTNGEYGKTSTIVPSQSSGAANPESLWPR